MEQNKKRRNSILKKKIAEEDTTTETKARRISFSGKKSVKEFIAGEEAATIWGTSYEVSADDLQVNSTESGLNKRVELQNRGVVVEPQKQRRRSSLKKKVLIAENDKENVCIQATPPLVETRLETNPLPFSESTKPQSPIKSELSLMKIHEDLSKSRQAMPQKKCANESVNICSSTFDFINYSGQINKTINIEQSLDVTLSTLELQMFKFRVPVTATDISPNLSMNSQRDGSSLNNLCRSIIMSEEELKIMREKKADMINKLKVIEANRSQVGINDNVVNLTDTPSEKSEIMFKANHSMDISQFHDAKGSKRKSERTPQCFPKYSNFAENNSPMPKKQMFTLYSSSMDVTNNDVKDSSQKEHTEILTFCEPTVVDETTLNHKVDSNKKPTIYFDSFAVDESRIGMQFTNTSRHTIVESKTINETTTFFNTTASCLAMGDQIDTLSMKLSTYAQNDSNDCADVVSTVQQNTRTNLQTISHFPEDDDIKYSMAKLAKQQQSDNSNEEMDVVSIIEDSVKASSNSTVKIRETNNGSTDTELMKLISNEASSSNSKKQRQSLYTPTDMIEESLEPFALKFANQHADSKNNKQRKSIYTPSDMIEESPKPNKPTETQRAHCSQTSYASKGIQPTLFTPEDIIADTSYENQTKSELQKTFKTPINMFEDSINIQPPLKATEKPRQTIYDCAAIDEDTVSIAKLHEVSKNNKQKESIYTPSDMIEESPKPKSIKIMQTLLSVEDAIEDISKENQSKIEQKTSITPINIFEDSINIQSASKETKKHRQTIYDCAAIDEDIIFNQNLHVVSKNKKQRESIYTPSDMIEESPNPTKPIQVQTGHSSQTACTSKGIKIKQTLSTPKDIIADTSNESQTKSDLQKTFKTPINIFEDSINIQPSSKATEKHRQTIYDSAAISEDIVFNQKLNVVSKNKKQRQSIYSPSDMIEESPKSYKVIEAQKVHSSQTACTSKGLQMRQTLSNPEDIIEETCKENQTESELQKTFKTPIDIFEDSFNIQPALKATERPRQTINDSAIDGGIVFKKKLDVVSKNKKLWESIYSPSNMIEESPKPIKAIEARTAHSSETSWPLKGIRTRQTISTPEDIIEDACKENQTKSELQTTFKTPINIFEDSIIIQPASKATEKPRQTIYDSAAIDEDTVFNQKLHVFSKHKKHRESICSPSDMVEESPKPNKTIEARTAHSSQTSWPSKGIQIRQTHSTPEDIIEDACKENQNKSELQTTFKTPINIFEDSIKIRPTLKETEKPRQTIYDSAAIDEDIVFNQKLHVVSKNKKHRESIYSPSDMIEESPKSYKAIEAQKAHFSQTACTSKGLRMRQTISTPGDIIEETRKENQTNSDLQTTVKTPINIFVDSINIQPASKATEKPRQTIYDSVGIDEDIVFNQKMHVFSKNKQHRESIYSPSDMIEESPKPNKAIEARTAHSSQTSWPSKGIQMRQTLSTPEDIIEDACKENQTKSELQTTFKTPINIFEESIKIQPTFKATEKPRRTIYDSPAIDEDIVFNQKLHVVSKNKKQRESIYTPSDMIEESPKSNKAEAQKTHSAQTTCTSKGIQIRQTLFTPEDIIEDTCNENQTKSELRKTLKTPINIFEDSINIQTATKATEKPCQTIYDPAAIDQETVFSPKPHVLSKKNKQRESIYIQSDMIESPKFNQSINAQKAYSSQTSYEPKDIIEQISDENKPSKHATAKYRQTVYNVADIINETIPTQQAMVASNNMKSRQSVYTPSDMIEDSPPKSSFSTDSLSFSKPVPNIEESFQVATAPKANNKCRQTIYDIADIEETTVPIQHTIACQNPPKTPNCKYRTTVHNSVNVEDDLNPIQHEIDSNRRNMHGKSVYSPSDMQLDESLLPQSNNTQLAETFKASQDMYEYSIDYIELIRVPRETNTAPINVLENSSAEKYTLIPIVNGRQTTNVSDMEEATAAIQNATKINKLREHQEDPAKYTHTVEVEHGVQANEIQHFTTEIKTIHNHKKIQWDESQKAKCHETPSKFSRSLMEYLKAEEEAIQSDSIYMSEDEDIFYDAEDAEIPDKRLTCHVPVNMLEESGIQPLQKHVLKRQTLFSPKDMTNESIDHEKCRLAKKKTDKDLKIVQNETCSNVDSSNEKQTLDFLRKCLFQKPFEPTERMELTQEHNTTDINERINMVSLSDMHSNRPNVDTLSVNTVIKENERYEENSEKETAMDVSMIPDNSIKTSRCKNPALRKTMVFSNENAVDESFFGENTPKPSLKKNRQTLHFNNSINTEDVSTTSNKTSSPVQSLKDLLLENTRLFQQSNILKPNSLVKQRSTIFFREKDNSMEASYMDCGPTNECTPSKNKVSRIPQLIGSAKKLESLKNSVEFIQQELPKLGCKLTKEDSFESVRDFSKEGEEETPRRESISVPKKLQDSFKKYELSRKRSGFKPIQLEKSSDTIEIPHKTAMMRGTEEQSRKVVRHLEESFDTIEIPRKFVSRKTKENSQRTETILSEKLLDENSEKITEMGGRRLQESFDTVDLPRRGTTFQRNETIYLCPNDIDTTTNASRKSLYQFEDEPITISDVSTFFAQKLQPPAQQTITNYSPNATKTLCKLNVNEFQNNPRSSDSDDTEHKFIKFKKRYFELTCNSISVPGMRDDIEKTHLSLVNTLDDESKMVSCQKEIELETKPLEITDETFPPVQEPLKPIPSVCRKCKRHRLSMTQNETTIGSFMLEPLPVYKMDLNALQQLENKPKLSDALDIWYQKIRQSDTFNFSDGNRSLALDDHDSVDIDNFMLNLENERIRNAEHRQQHRKEIKTEPSFVYRLQKEMQSKPDWILNALLLTNNVLKLTHSRIRTFAIFMDFTPKDLKGIEVDFNEIQLVPNNLHTRQWKPFEYAWHYQLLVELPFDLKKICPTSEQFSQFFQLVENVTQDVIKTGKDMLSVILASPACLIREPSGSLYIRKYIRTKNHQNEVKRTEIHIEVRNIKKISYESIIMPPLYEFDEKIQQLPEGHSFLKIFLENPLNFMKT